MSDTQLAVEYGITKPEQLAAASPYSSLSQLSDTQLADEYGTTKPE